MRSRTSRITTPATRCSTLTVPRTGRSVITAMAPLAFTEVIEKPAGGEPTTWTLCYIPNKGQSRAHGCTGTVLYREKGVYEQDVKMTSFWQNDSIVWAQGIKEMHLVFKDGSGGSGHAHKRADPEKFFPTKMRITMVQVSAGSTYDSKLVPNLPPKK